MAIDRSSTAPYTPAAALIAGLRHWRVAPAAQVDEDFLLDAGVGRTVAPRTMQSLRLLDMVDEDGRPLEALSLLRHADDAEYRHRLAEWLRTAYGWVFDAVGDPRASSDQQLMEAFRANRPAGQRSRMVALFVGLCKEAGLIDGAPSRTLAAARASPRSSDRATTPVGGRVAPLARDDERRQAYVDLLMEKVRASDGERDQALLARLEWLLGFRPTPPDAEHRSV